MQTRSVERAVWLGLITVVAVVVLVGLWSLRGRMHGHRPPVLGAVPPFSLVERSGRPVSRADLAGSPWIADFIFTRCSGTCPALSARMGELRRKLRDQHLQARLVSFSVDPSHDTPEVLRGHGPAHGLDPANWLLLTTTADEAEDTTRKLAKAFGHTFTKAEDGTQTHGIVTHVIDKDGR